MDSCVQMAGKARSQEQEAHAGLGLRIEGSGQLSDLTNIDFLSHGLATSNSMTDLNDENWCPTSANGHRPSAQDCGKSFAQQAYKQSRGPNATVFLSNSVASSTLRPASPDVCGATPLISEQFSAAKRLAHQYDGVQQAEFGVQSSAADSLAAVHTVDGLGLCPSKALRSPVTNRSPESSRRAFKSHPTSPTLRQRMVPTNHLPAGLVSRPVSSRPGFAHRSSHSLGQVGSFAPLVIGDRVSDYSYASAPGSPAENIHQHTLAAFLQLSGHRQPVTHLVSEQPAFFTGFLSHDRHARSSSMHPISPCTSMASTSFSSISPMGSSRLNHDGSFTSQENSFDSVSNAASESMSRASSSFDELHHNDGGSMGLPSSARITKSKVRLRNIDRKLICDYSSAHPDAKQENIASQFGIERSTVSKILKQKDKWLAIDPESDLAHIAKHRAVKFPAIEQRLTNWISRLKSEGTVIKDTMIRKEALRIAKDLGVAEDKFKASGGWIEKFRERRSLPKVVPKSQHMSIDSPASNGEPSIQPDRLMLGVLASWNGSAPGRPEIGNADPPVLSATLQVDTSPKRVRSETAAVAPTFSPSSPDNNEAQWQFDGERNRAPGSHSAMAQGSVQSIAHAQDFMNTVPSHSQLDVQCDSKAATYYAMDEPLDASPLKRRRTDTVPFTSPDRQVDSSDDIKSSAAVSDSAAHPDLAQAKATRTHRHKSVNTASALNSSKRRGRSPRTTVQVSTPKCHQPKTPSPLRSTRPELQPNLDDRSAGGSTGGDAVSAALLERLDRIKHDASLTVSPGQAQQSLDLVIKFLNEQPRTFLPSDQLAVFDHLQANIEQLVRGDSELGVNTESITSHSGADVSQAEQESDSGACQEHQRRL